MQNRVPHHLFGKDWFNGILSKSLMKYSQEYVKNTSMGHLIDVLFSDLVGKAQDSKIKMSVFAFSRSPATISGALYLFYRVA